MADQEKLAKEALEEIGGGGVWDKIRNMSTAKKAALGTSILALLGIGGHEIYTKGGWSKAAWDKAKGLWRSNNLQVTTSRPNGKSITINFPYGNLADTFPKEDLQKYTQLWEGDDGNLYGINVVNGEQTYTLIGSLPDNLQGE